jgi:hypothetical protein
MRPLTLPGLICSDIPVEFSSAGPSETSHTNGIFAFILHSLISPQCRVITGGRV